MGGMTYTSLVAAKGTAYSIANWVNYSKLDTGAVVDEAQNLLWGSLRCREMMTDTAFTMTAGAANIPLPTGFLDPIGRIYRASFNDTIRHKDGNFVQRARTYTENTGTLGTNPFTTTNGSNTVAVALPGHGFNQASIFYTTGATLFNGVTIAGTFSVSSIIDANNFNIDITSLGVTPTGSGTGGGASAIYTVDILIAGTPLWWGIWNETIHFDQAFFQTSLCKLQFYKSPPLLSPTNLTNFMTNRYPHLMRAACVTAAADFMKDDGEYQKGAQRLTALIQQVNAENEMQYRGMELDTDTP